jgi:hypothetical protein
MQHGGIRSPNVDFSIGENLRVKQDVDLAVDEGVLSVPAGTVGQVVEVSSDSISVDLGNKLGGFSLGRGEVTKYFDRITKEEARQAMGTKPVTEANAVAVTPGRRVRVARYDPVIGPNRGPGSPGLGGYESLVGQLGEIQTVFGTIKGIKTYKVNLVQGGQFVLGETELQVLGESTQKPELKPVDVVALRTLGFGY